MGGLRPCSLRAARPSLGAPARLPPLATSPPDGSISCRPPGRGRPAFAEVPYPFRASARVVGCPTVQRAPASARVRDLPPTLGSAANPCIRSSHEESLDVSPRIQNTTLYSGSFGSGAVKHLSDCSQSASGSRLSSNG